MGSPPGLMDSVTGTGESAAFAIDRQRGDSLYLRLLKRTFVKSTLRPSRVSGSKGGFGPSQMPQPVRSEPGLERPCRVSQ